MIIKRKKIIADLFTPVSVFSFFKDEKFSFLLESAEKGKTGRYSFIGFSPRRIYKLYSDRVEILKRDNSKYVPHKKIMTCNPLEILKEVQKKYKTDVKDKLPPFCGGLVGYTDYEIISTWENIKFKKSNNLDIIGIFIFIDEIIAFDHFYRTAEIIKLVFEDCAECPLPSENKAKKRVNEISDIITSQPTLKQIPLENDIEIDFISNFTKKEFIKAVIEIKNEILKGEIIQGVFSQRLETSVIGDPFNYYRSLRVINPSPYMFYLKMDKTILCGSSPEVLVKVIDTKAFVRPIAGTRPRAKTEKEEKLLLNELKSDIKERAEHIMLVDLGRNDLSKVCEYGTVKVNNLMTVEKFSHVMHLVTNVTGRIKKNISNIDVFKSCFPAGTVSGAPKIRAIEIIRDKETIKRGPYAGAVGYFSFTGDMDMCINIRTMVIKEGKVYVQAGAGIVADSNPEMEYHETLNKAKALLESVRLCAVS